MLLPPEPQSCPAKCPAKKIKQGNSTTHLDPVAAAAAAAIQTAAAAKGIFSIQSKRWTTPPWLPVAMSWQHLGCPAKWKR